MPIDLTPPGGVTLALIPELVLTAWALVLMRVAAWRHQDAMVRRDVGLLTIIAVVSTGLAVAWLWARGPTSVGVPAMMSLDGFRFATSLVFLLGALLTVMLSLGYVDREHIQAPEYYVLILFATLGMMFMAGAADLVVMFLGLELMSVAVYVLAGVNRKSVFAAEAALKYFLLGAFASGFFLYGIAMIYGATGTTNLWLIHGRVLELGLGS